MMINSQRIETFPQVQHNPSEKLSCLFINTYYEGFLNSYYSKTPNLANKSYATQMESLQAQCFGDSDFYSHGLIKQGWQAEDLIINCSQLQQAWSRENHGIATDLGIAVDQIKSKCPDIVYLQDLNIASADFLTTIRPFTKLIVGQIASPLPQQCDIKNLDIIFSSFPHFVERFRDAGIAAYYQPLAFSPKACHETVGDNRCHAATFVGGLSPAHSRALNLLEYLAESTPIQFWGYGAPTLSAHSPILPRHHGEIWGKDMFSILSKSFITVNRHIDVSENYANNMRLFEATGCGALLITDYRDNLNELFEIGEEVVAYRSAEECAALIEYYLAHPEEAAKIAAAGQTRTRSRHTYEKRMEQTAEILTRHIRYRGVEKSTVPDWPRISYGYESIQPEQITDRQQAAWQDEAIPTKQRALVQHQLRDMYNGNTPVPFSVLADSIRPLIRDRHKILELGCSSGYYYEILEYLLNKRIDYSGVDYSYPLISMARNYYPKPKFYVADGSNLPFENSAFDSVISSGILLHVKNYKAHIEETIRVAGRYIVLHRTPISRQSVTQYYKKFAYDREVFELRFNEYELVSEFLTRGMALIGAYELHADEVNDKFDITYVFEREISSPIAPEAGMH